jgi:putative transposase
MSCGSSMLAITFSFPPQRTHCSISIPNTREELEKWARRHGVERRFIRPGRPMQNGHVERLNRTYREEVLNCYVFETLGEVRQMTAEWIARYNEIRPHESLGNLSPRQYLMAKSP